MFNGVSYDVTGYDSNLVMISDQTYTRQRCFYVRHWVTVTLLKPFFCANNVGDTLYNRCMQPMICIILCSFLYNLMPPFRRMHVCLFVPLGFLGVLALSHPKEKGSPDYLSHGCAQVGGLLTVNVEHQLGWYCLLLFCGGATDL